MLRTPTIGSLAVAAGLLATALGLPTPAQAHGRHGGRGYVGVAYGGLWGPGAYWGMGMPYWGVGWGPVPYYAPQQSLLGFAMMSGMGGIEVNVKPNRAEVWVDGKYVADARDLDGVPNYLWLKKGTHHVVLYKAGFKSFDAELDVSAGVLRELKVMLEKGESQPPVRVAEPPQRQGEAAVPPGSGPLVDVTAPQTAEPRMESSSSQGAQSGPQGEVSLRVEPKDATVYVDGRFVGAGRDLRALLLPAGRHRIEAARPGYRDLMKEFDVEVGHRGELSLSMERVDSKP